MPRTLLRASMSAIVVVAIALLVHPSTWSVSRFSRVGAASISARPAANELPDGFILPPSDAQLPVAALIAADLDADGDLDIVATNSADGLVGIVVWVNDGTGQLTRKAPKRVSDLGNDPAPPWLARHDGASNVSIQPHGHALQSTDGPGWLTLPSSRCLAAATTAAESALPRARRSRAPPDLLS
jgi:hypothetical protein